MAKILVPEIEKPITVVAIHIDQGDRDQDFFGATCARCIRRAESRDQRAAMLVAFGADLLMQLHLGRLSQLTLGHGVSRFPSSPQQIFGWIFAPVDWLVAVPLRDCLAIGNLLGVRMVLNEIVAFSFLGPMRNSLDPRSFTIATFALCGSANFSFIGIQIAGIGALAPNQKRELARLGVRAMIAGTMANFVSASIAGRFMP
jgi:concentrative nucleoside transporter, CNT family